MHTHAHPCTYMHTHAHTCTYTHKTHTMCTHIPLHTYWPIEKLWGQQPCCWIHQGSGEAVMNTWPDNPTPPTLKETLSHFPSTPTSRTPNHTQNHTLNHLPSTHTPPTRNHTPKPHHQPSLHHHPHRTTPKTTPSAISPPLPPTIPLTAKTLPSIKSRI